MSNLLDRTGRRAWDIAVNEHEVDRGNVYENNILLAAKEMIIKGLADFTFVTQWSSGNSLWRYDQMTYNCDISHYRK